MICWAKMNNIKHKKKMRLSTHLSNREKYNKRIENYSIGFNAE